MPKTIHISESGYSGVSVTYTKTNQRIDLSGWYSSYCHIPGGAMTLRDFFNRLGITEKDCARAFKVQDPEPHTPEGTTPQASVSEHQKGE